MPDLREIWMDIPRPFMVGKRSVSVYAPTPLRFVIPDPWNPDAAGVEPEPSTGDAGHPSSSGSAED